jgi:hypothetical protein
MRPANSSLTPTLITLVLWGAFSGVLAQRGAFVTTPEQPPVALLLSLLIPLALFAIGYAVTGRFRTYVLGLDLVLLTAVQAWRVLGGMFLVLMAFRLLPPAFAWPAGLGDLIVGIYAPFVVMAVVKGSRNWRAQVVLLSILGLVDFAGAIGLGVLSGSSPVGFLREEVTTDIMQRFPLSLIPTFAVPAWAIAHIVSLLQVRNDRGPFDRQGELDRRSGDAGRERSWNPHF